MKEINKLNCAIAVILASACTKVEEPVHVSGIQLSETSLVMTEGDEARPTATVLPENTDNNNHVWATSDNAISIVTDGKVTAERAGEAVISVKTEDAGKTAECRVVVNARVYHIESVALANVAPRRSSERLCYRFCK